MYVVDHLWLPRFVEVRLSPYIASELPAALLLRKIGPKTLMPTLLTLWGIVVTLQGAQLNHSKVHTTIDFLNSGWKGLSLPSVVCLQSGFFWAS